MSEVVGDGSNAGVEKVTEHEKVGGEEEDCEEEPARVEVLVGEEGEDEDEGFFGAEEDRRAGQHRWIVYTGSWVKGFWRVCG